MPTQSEEQLRRLIASKRKWAESISGPQMCDANAFRGGDIIAFCDELEAALGASSESNLHPLVTASRDLLEIIYQLDARGDLPDEISGEVIDAVRNGLLGASSQAQSQLWCPKYGGLYDAECKDCKAKQSPCPMSTDRNAPARAEVLEPQVLIQHDLEQLDDVGLALLLGEPEASIPGLRRLLGANFYPMIRQRLAATRASSEPAY